MVDYASIVNAIKDLVTKVEESKPSAEVTNETTEPTTIEEPVVESPKVEPEVKEEDTSHFPISDELIKDIVDSIITDDEAKKLAEKVEDLIKKLKEDVFKNLDIKPDNETVKDLIDPTKHG